MEPKEAYKKPEGEDRRLYMIMMVIGDDMASREIQRGWCRNGIYTLRGREGVKR